MRDRDLEQRIIRLEEFYSHQQHLIQQLNDVLIELREQNDRLRDLCQSQQSKIDWLIGNVAESPANDKPPHY